MSASRKHPDKRAVALASARKTQCHAMRGLGRARRQSGYSPFYQSFQHPRVIRIMESPPGLYLYTYINMYRHIGQDEINLSYLRNKENVTKSRRFWHNGLSCLKYLRVIYVTAIPGVFRLSPEIFRITAPVAGAKGARWRKSAPFRKMEGDDVEF
jgi:hypothetical protein